MKIKVTTEQLSNIDELLEYIVDCLDSDEAILEEVRKAKIPVSVKKKLRSRSERRKLLEKCGNKAFLEPEDLKFPVIEPGNERCEYSCRLLLAAYIRANQWKKKHPEYEKIAEKAKKLYIQNKCNSKIQIELHEVGIFDVFEFFTLYNIF